MSLYPDPQRSLVLKLPGPRKAIQHSGALRAVPPRRVLLPGKVEPEPCREEEAPATDRPPALQLAFRRLCRSLALTSQVVHLILKSVLLTPTMPAQA